MSHTTRIGIIGGGLMGREVASALSRWFVLENFPVHAELTAVCDLAEKQREWFRQIPSVKLLTADYHELLASPDVDVVYVAVPHNMHETIYLDVLKAGKDLLAEKPFGIPKVSTVPPFQSTQICLLFTSENKMSLYVSWSISATRTLPIK